MIDLVPSYSRNPPLSSIQWTISPNSVIGDDFKIHIVLNKGPLGSESNIAEAWSLPFSIISPTYYTDTDKNSQYFDGINPNTRGTVTDKNGVSRSDSCVSGQPKVTEWYCNADGTSSSIQINCPSSQCNNGAC